MEFVKEVGPLNHSTNRLSSCQANSGEGSRHFAFVLRRPTEDNTVATVSGAWTGGETCGKSTTEPFLSRMSRLNC
jgi:hypothetical protein